MASNDGKTSSESISKQTSGDDRHNFEYFWRDGSPFNQCYLCEFIVKGTTFNCAEQFMMFEKSLLFGDNETAEQILKTKTPKEQKALGRKIQKFDQALWDRNCLGIVKRGNAAKFSQNPKLKELLVKTHPRIIVEASPEDKIWGIGLAEDDPLAWNKETWKGKNLLGYALTEVRDDLIRKEQNIS